MAYRIKTVEKLTGISRNTITAWERRYSLIEPEKDASGYRAYSESDVSTLQRVKSLVDEGYQISEVVKMIRAADDTAATSSPLAPDAMRHELQKHLHALDRAAAQEVHRRVRMLPLEQRLELVYLPILTHTGDLWEDGRIGIGQEHFTSTYIRAQMIDMLSSIDQGPRAGNRAVCAGFPGEDHELALLTVAVRLALHGMRITYLGGNMPAAALVDVLRSKPADLVCSSVMHRRQADELLAWARHVRDHSTGTTVVLGGPGVTIEAEPGIVVAQSVDELLATLND